MCRILLKYETVTKRDLNRLLPIKFLCKVEKKQTTLCNIIIIIADNKKKEPLLFPARALYKKRHRPTLPPVTAIPSALAGL
uniref:hypothetical protein n=1 Tax=Sphingobacterium lumbrici TaxID=2559600 RepID=UPI001C10164E